MLSAMILGGSSPALLRGFIMLTMTSAPRSTAAADKTLAIFSWTMSVTMSTVSPALSETQLSMIVLAPFIISASFISKKTTPL
ncbi:hypothetical protein SDC9_133180 [bioreactor metagenome]|uniref:Uncharacterized protein n=1 Tax=bioreactor metagenome TaxID=1076179 RepID=A0A645DA85_9ZZZZ